MKKDIIVRFAIIVLSLLLLLSGCRSSSNEEVSEENEESMGSEAAVEAKSPDYALFLKENEIYYTDFKSDPIQITSKLAENDTLGYYTKNNLLPYYCRISDDGKFVFYPDKNDIIDEYELGLNIYYRNLAEPESDPIKLDSDVMLMNINEDFTCVTYLKGEEGSLYQYDIASGEKEKIATNVEEYVVSADGNIVGYYNNENAVYFKERGKDKEKIASDVETISYVSEDMTFMYYIKDDTLYKQVVGEEREKIASNVHKVIKIYPSGEVYFSRFEDDEHSLAEFIYDDMLRDDEAIAYPIEPTEPSYYDYDTWSDYDAAYDQYLIDYNEYVDDYYAYQDKLERDAIRDDILTYEFDIGIYSLYYYDGSEESLISDAYVSDYNFDAKAEDAPVVTFMELFEPEKLKFSDILASELVIVSEFDIYSIVYTVEEKLSESLQLRVALNGEKQTIEGEDFAEVAITSAGDAIYFIADMNKEKEYGELYKATVVDGEISGVELFDSDVSEYGFQLISDDLIQYYKDCNDSKGDLYIDKNRIDYEVYRYSGIYSEKDEKFVYLIDVSESKGTLKVNQNGENTKISDDVYTNIKVINDYILYLYDYSDKYGKGTLYYYKDGETHRIADDVSAIIECQDEY